ncbi:formate dehydrogenase accessory sulfurtransferase FdhD [Micrococcales bacterium 31B]|nr:formate dehydrogenase accessory sulfurtransferase FdhD [Micrococcales bacterium 31B]
MGRITARRKILTLDLSAPSRRERIDQVSVEEPLEIRVGGAPLAVTMRTPGHDIDLAHGFLLTEGMIRSAADIHTARYCAGAVVDDEFGMPENTYNVLDIALRAGVPAPSVDVSRNFYTTSSCGVCGKASIDNIRTRSEYPLGGAGLEQAGLEPAVVASLPDALREAQAAFDRTGGLHAAGLFTYAGDALVVREDVGRHNAVDKVIGWAAQRDLLPLAGHVLMVSGRASFELTQKACMAGIPVLAAVSAPSSLAVDLADELGLTLIGFVRGQRMNVYTHAGRLGPGDN